MTKKNNKKKVMVFGTFDGLHAGHLNLFEQAKGLGDELVVCVARDSTVKDLKKKKPCYTMKERMKHISNYALVDKVIEGDPVDHMASIKEEKPDIIALGYDQRFFIDELEAFLNESKMPTKVKRLMPYHPEKYKSKILNAC